jgi:hypothetical protein
VFTDIHRAYNLVFIWVGSNIYLTSILSEIAELLPKGILEIMKLDLSGDYDD